MILAGETEVLGEKPVTVPLCPQGISHGLTWVRTQASEVRGPATDHLRQEELKQSAYCEIYRLYLAENTLPVHYNDCTKRTDGPNAVLRDTKAVGALMDTGRHVD